MDTQHTPLVALNWRTLPVLRLIGKRFGGAVRMWKIAI
jgi:hypothetical protein